MESAKGVCGVIRNKHD